MWPGDNEGRIRSLLAAAILCSIALAAWTGGCGRTTVVEPDAASSVDLGDGADGIKEVGDSGRAPVVEAGDSASDADDPWMGCCTESEAPRCVDSTQAARCAWQYNV